MLLEIIIDPTSSIIFQRIEPTKDIMKEKPRNINESILNGKNIFKSILQGVLIFMVVFINYFILIHNNYDTNLCVTISYSILVLSIMLITYQLKSNTFTLKSFILSFKDKVSLVVNIGVILGLILLIYVPFFNNIAHTTPIDIKWWIYIILFVFVSILPFDIFKIINKKK